MRTRFSKPIEFWPLIIITLLTITTTPLFAAVSNYTFATLNQSYTPLASGTLLIPGSTETIATTTFNDALDGGLQQIGFDFCFDGVSYDQFTAYTGGVFTLGSSTIPDSGTIPNSRYTNNLVTAAAYPVIAPWWDHQHSYDGGGTANGCGFNPPIGVRYFLSGVVPTRTLTIEWNTQIADTNNSFWWAGCDLTMNRYQAILHEGSDGIEFRYGSLWAVSGQPTLSTIGLAAGAANFLSVTPTGGTATVSSTTSNNTISAHVALIPQGTVYTFQPPMKSPTTITATGLASTIYGQPATIAATITGGSAPTGKVYFLEGTAVLGSIPVTGDLASMMLDLPIGTHTITVIYTGDCTRIPSSASFSYSVTAQQTQNPKPKSIPIFSLWSLGVLMSLLSLAAIRWWR